MKLPKLKADLSDLIAAAGLGGIFYGVFEIWGQGWAALITGAILLGLGLLTSRPDGGK